MSSLVTPAIDLDDHDTPSGTSAAYALLAQLGKTDARYAEAATKMLARMTTKFNLRPPLGQASRPMPHFTGKLWRRKRKPLWTAPPT